MKITFGKWRGTELRNVDLSYLTWLAGQNIKHNGIDWSQEAREQLKHSSWSGFAGCMVTQDERDEASEFERQLAQDVEEDQAKFDATLRADMELVMAAYRAGTPLRRSEIASPRGLALVESVVTTEQSRAYHAWCTLLTLAGLSVRANADPEIDSSWFEFDAYKRIAEEIRSKQA